MNVRSGPREVRTTRLRIGQNCRAKSAARFERPAKQWSYPPPVLLTLSTPHRPGTSFWLLSKHHVTNYYHGIEEYIHVSPRACRLLSPTCNIAYWQLYSSDHPLKGMVTTIPDTHDQVFWSRSIQCTGVHLSKTIEWSVMTNLDPLLCFPPPPGQHISKYLDLRPL